MIDLSGRVALVSGGSRGIGAATVRLLARAGASVAFTYRTRRDDADALVRRIETAAPFAGPPVRPAVRPIQAELSEPSGCQRAVTETLNAFGHMDILVANHGIWPPEDVPLTEMSDEHWRRTMAVNLDGVFYLCRAALRAMRDGPGGETGEGGAAKGIVIVTSTAAQRGEALHADYAASKGALVAFVKSLAVEAAPRVTVNSVAPGWVDTEMAAAPYAGAGRKKIEAGIPLGRVAAADDIAGPIVFLCSDLARHVTGEILNVNGGSVLCG